MACLVEQWGYGEGGEGGETGCRERMGLLIVQVKVAFIR